MQLHTNIYISEYVLGGFTVLLRYLHLVLNMTVRNLEDRSSAKPL